jgi:enoyl-CoA hydratase/carnithine racemase
MTVGDLRYERHGPVRLITIDRADVMNSLDFAANDALIACWQEFDADDAARVAVITGAGEQAFCAGADLKTYTMAYATTPAPEFVRRFTNGPGFGGITRTQEIFKPIIAAVNGYAMSGGLELALACDLRFCAPHAEFALQDVKWGFHACDGALVRLPWIIGLGHAFEMFLSGDRFDADWALRTGLVNRVIAADELVAFSLDYAAKLASRAPLAQRLGKEAMLRALGRPIEDGLRLESRSFHDLGLTSDLDEGTRAFREKRDADFEGR